MKPRTVPSVPEQCLEAAELADEIISASTVTNVTTAWP